MARRCTGKILCFSVLFAFLSVLSACTVAAYSPLPEMSGEAAERVDETVPETDTAAAEGASYAADKTEAAKNIKKPVKAGSASSKQKEITLVAIGDMLMHPQVSGLAFQPDGSIDYSFIFEPIEEEVSAADIAVVNNEVPFAGNQLGLQNYPNFNVYTELGDAEVNAGFNVILNATNHTMDQGLSGAMNTLNFWKKYPMITVLGLHDSEEAQAALDIIEVKGVKIALYNCTYGSNGGGAAGKPYVLDLMTDANREKIREELLRAEKEADFTIVFPHWGTEYKLQEDASQRAWAEFFTECGADLIIGTHPHCVEPVRKITASNGNTSVCYYSLGNYISMQDETISMLGGLARVTLSVEKDGVKIAEYDTEYLVTHYEWDMDKAYVVRLNDYTEAMAERHGIKTHDFQGGGLNPYYPFKLSTFYRVVDEMNGKGSAAVTPPPTAAPETTEETETEQTEAETTESTSETEAESGTDGEAGDAGESSESTENGAEEESEETPDTQETDGEPENG